MKIINNNELLDKDWYSLEKTPPWRRPNTKLTKKSPTAKEISSKDKDKAETYVLLPSKQDDDNDSEGTLERINLALALRKPILVTGVPGLGKSTLAYYLAYLLDLGKPLIWPINSRTTLKEGLYFYDAVGHLGDSQLKDSTSDISDYVTLGPLGTAMYPYQKPRVLLIDEIDKANNDLPNDLLHVLEEGTFAIEELRRSVKKSKGSTAKKILSNDGEKVPPLQGEIEMHHYPVIVLTSNAEREFPQAFRRRCIELHLQKPSIAIMAQLVVKRFEKEKGYPKYTEKQIVTFLQSLEGYNDNNKFPPDVILQSIFAALLGGENKKMSVLDERREMVENFIDVLKR